mgnify:CR=1 FL=1
MAPIKSSLARTVGKLLGVQKDTDLSLRGHVQSIRKSPSEKVSASGGNIADALAPGNGYKYHTFGTPGTFTVSAGQGADGIIEVLVVAGGGGGQKASSIAMGGAGAGGVVHATSYVVTPGTYAVSVGDGGSGGTGTAAGTNGGDSYFGGAPERLTAKGGGCVGAWPGVAGASGGSGAGGRTTHPDYPSGTAPSIGKPATQPAQTHPGAPGTITNYGNEGGDGGHSSGNYMSSGGGGGAGAAGGDGGDGSSTPAGGDGQSFPQFAYPLCFPSPYLPGFATPGNAITGYQASPSSDHYGGGGGGGKHIGGGGSSQTGTGLGGIGGGGRGGNGQPVHSLGGLDYLGGGAGDSAGYETTALTGGKGVVIVRYVA